MSRALCGLCISSPSFTRRVALRDDGEKVHILHSKLLSWWFA